MGAVALVAGVSAGMALRRRRQDRLTTKPPARQAETAASTNPPAPVVPPPSSSQAAPDAPFELTLEAERLSVSLLNATLQYRLTLRNRRDEPLAPVRVAADMIGAHAAHPQDGRIVPDSARLETRHAVPGLTVGESVVLRGELRLPLREVTPIRNGAARLLVPLVRMRAETGRTSCTRVIVVGESARVPGGPLRPFRLDAGPRIFGAVDQRQVAGGTELLAEDAPDGARALDGGDCPG